MSAVPSAAERPIAPRDLATLALSVALFALTWPLMKLALQDGSPLWLAAVRMSLGSLSAFLLLAALGQLRRPGRADWPIVLSIAGLQLAGFFALGNLGLRHVPAGRSVLLAYTTTLWLLPIGVLCLGERLGWARGLGALSGIAGGAVLFNPAGFDWGDADARFGNLCLLGAALIWAVAIVHARRHVWRLTPLQLLPWQMLVGAAMGAILALVFEPDGFVRPTPLVIGAMAWMGFVSGPIGTWTSVLASRALPTLVTSLGFLCVPLIGLALSVVWLGEPLGADLIGGAVLILLGLLLVSRS